jgi:hypothetical protein
MNQRVFYCLLFGVMLMDSAMQAEEIRLTVRHLHAIGSCQGALVFRETGIEFVTPDKKHARNWKYEDIQQLGLLGSKEISILTYEDNKWEFGKDRNFRFEVTAGEITPALWSMLQTRVSRPVVSAIIPPEVKPKYQIPVKHQRGMGGTSGTLEVSDQYLVYRTETTEDSRIWRYEDISSMGSTGPYQLRLTSTDRVQGEFGGERNFIFSLKRKLDPEIYDFIWWKINGPQISYKSNK